MSVVAGNGSLRASPFPPSETYSAFSSLSSPTSIACNDGDGDTVYVVSGENQILKLSVSSSSLDLFAGVGGPPSYGGDGDLAVAAFLSDPQGLALFGGFLYVAGE